jgi:hypothetical protein
MEGLIVLMISGSAGLALWKLAEYENNRELAEYVERVGGSDSPWAPDIRNDVKKEPTRQFWKQFDEQYSEEEQLAIERDPTWGLCTPAMSPSVSAMPLSTSPQPPQPVSTHEATTTAQPAVEPVAPTSWTTGCGDTSQDWLSDNGLYFPVAVPPIKIEYPKDRKALVLATHWVTKALDAGVSQNKIVSVVFGKSKGTADYDRIVEIIREVRDE